MQFEPMWIRAKSTQATHKTYSSSRSVSSWNMPSGRTVRALSDRSLRVSRKHDESISFYKRRQKSHEILRQALVSLMCAHFGGG